MSRTTKKREQLKRLFKKQQGLCHWCGAQMQPPGSYVQEFRSKPPIDLCTYDHLDDKFSPNRGKFPGHPRNVAACWQCNNRRAIESQAAQPIEEIRRRAGQESRRYATPCSAQIVTMADVWPQS